jgi:hypothetical protein
MPPSIFYGVFLLTKCLAHLTFNPAKHFCLSKKDRKIPIYGLFQEIFPALWIKCLAHRNPLSDKQKCLSGPNFGLFGQIWAMPCG